ncbi:MAG: McrC family protein [Deltaproteobacteria bacterium]|jgi:5-methylcytosine-specific restriction enzyme subunit McrC|nr:McrC family protein [Deltaproteobacteria bacterium]
MRFCDKTFTITEYGGFARGAALCGFQGLPEKTFDALEAFILANKSEGGGEAVELLSISALRGAGKIIKARNYVGLVTMSDGTVIEILPKIAGAGISVNDAKRVFLEMLKTLKDAAFKARSFSRLRVERLNLFEIFVKMFLDEALVLTKQGLKASYVPVEGNERFCKGKLLASQNMKCNLASKDHFFVRYDDFNINRAENKLIKSTLRFLLKATGDGQNRQNAVRLLTLFDGVDYSTNYDADFAKTFVDRSMSHYGKTLSWCRVFLKGNSFTAYAGGEVALALLFPMEKVFESFVVAKLRKHIGDSAELRIQDRRYSLFDRPTMAFSLRPDIVMVHGGSTVVMDAKWKMLSENARNYGVSQADMCQMYAYGKKYAAEKVILLYPKSEEAPHAEISHQSNDGVKVEAAFMDLLNPDASARAIAYRARNIAVEGRQELL